MTPPVQPPTDKPLPRISEVMRLARHRCGRRPDEQPCVAHIEQARTELTEEADPHPPTAAPESDAGYLVSDACPHGGDDCGCCSDCSRLLDSHCPTCGECECDGAATGECAYEDDRERAREETYA